MPKQIWKINQFHGGLNSSSDPRDIADNELSEATDVMVDELGKIRTMGGTTAHDAGSKTVTISPGYGLFAFSADRTGIIPTGVATVDTISSYYTDHDAGTYYNVTLTGEGGSTNAKATVVVTASGGTAVGTVDTTNENSLGWVQQPGTYPSVSLTGGSGSGCLATVVSVLDGIDSITVTSGGSGYVVDDTLTIAGGDIGASGTATCDVATLSDTTAGIDSITLTSAGSGYVVDEVLTIDKDDIGGAGTGNETCAVETLTPSGEAAQTGDNYLVLADNSTGDVGIYIYSEENDEWTDSQLIDIGATNDFAPCFYYVDGAVRISDGEFANTGCSNKWYGYISRTLFSGSQTFSINEWAEEQQKIEKPPASYFSESIDTGGITYIHSHTETAVNADSKYLADSALYNTLIEGNVCKVRVTVRARAGSYPASMNYTADIKIGVGDASGFTGYTNIIEISDVAGVYDYNYKTVVMVFSTTDIDISDATEGVRVEILNEDISGIGIVEISQIEYWDGVSLGIGHSNLSNENAVVEFAFDTTTDSSIWEDNYWEVGLSFIYDENQESYVKLLTRDDGTSPDFLDGVTAGQAPDIKFNFKYSDTDIWNKRITGANLYVRKYSNTDVSSWYHQIFYNFIDGVASLASGGKEYPIEYDATLEEYSVIIARSNMIRPNLVITHESRNGISKDEKSIMSKYKTAVVANRVAYIGNCKVEYEDGTEEVMSDAMVKSSVNKFDIFPLSRMIEVSVRDGDEIIKLEEYADRILQFKKHKMHLINVSQEIEFLEDTFMHKGVAHPAATCKTDFGIAWVNKHGCYLYDGKEVHNLLERKGRQIIKEEDWETFTTNEPMIGYIPKKRQLVIVDDNTATGTGKTYLYDMVTQSWIKGADDTFTSDNLTNFITDWNGDLAIAHTSGTVVKWDDSGDASSNFSLITKDIDFGQPAQRKKIYKVYVTYTGGSSGPQPEKTKVICSADDGGSLNEKYFTIYGADNHKIMVWFNVDDINSSQPDAIGYDHVIEVNDEKFNQNSTAEESAAIIAASISNFEDHDCVVNGNEIVITDKVNAVRTHASDGDSGFTITTIQEGTASTVAQDIDVMYAINGGTTFSQFDGDLTDDTGTQVEAELKPNESINNIKSIQLKFSGTASEDFEINDISIVYRLKPVR